jgi:hypothetical protein
LASLLIAVRCACSASQVQPISTASIQPAGREGHPGARQRSRLPKRVEPTTWPPAICTKGSARPAAASASASST